MQNQSKWQSKTVYLGQINQVEKLMFIHVVIQSNTFWVSCAVLGLEVINGTHSLPSRARTGVQEKQTCKQINYYLLSQVNG